MWRSCLSPRELIYPCFFLDSFFREEVSRLSKKISFSVIILRLGCCTVDSEGHCLPYISTRKINHCRADFFCLFKLGVVQRGCKWSRFSIRYWLNRENPNLLHISDIYLALRKSCSFLFGCTFVFLSCRLITAHGLAERKTLPLAILEYKWLLLPLPCLSNVPVLYILTIAHAPNLRTLLFILFLYYSSLLF